MPADVLVSEEPARIYIFEDLREVRELWVHAAQLFRAQAVCFRPVWLSPVSAHDCLIALEQSPVRHAEAVRPVRVRRQRRCVAYKGM